MCGLRDSPDAAAGDTSPDWGWYVDMGRGIVREGEWESGRVGEWKSGREDEGGSKEIME